jgi:hypothetical protein
MATIYRFIVEASKNNNVQQDPNGNLIPIKGAGSKGGSDGSGRGFNLGGSRGGVEHNRFMRPINPLMNRFTGGYWEKGQRVGRAVMALPNEFMKKGAGALTSVASLILLQFMIMEIDRWFREQKRKANEENQANFLKIKSGITQLGSEYKVNRDIFGRITYKNQ